MEIFFWINLILLLGLILLIIYEGRQIVGYKEQIELFIESNSEIFGVVNVNAVALRELHERVLVQEKTVDFLKVIIDAHAHVLRIYAPALRFQDAAESTKIQDLENFGE
jgi:hypothetical protein